MTTKQRCYLLDAGPIIGLHELGLWNVVAENVKLITTSYIAAQETLFWDDGEGVGRPILLTNDASQGLVELVDVDASELAATMRRFDPVAASSLQQGELECLTHLLTCDDPDLMICSADAAAIRAVCLLGFHDRAESLEKILSGVGRTVPGLKSKYRASTLEQWVRLGREQYVQGIGLAPD
jgi:hypothetical protein